MSAYRNYDHRGRSPIGIRNSSDLHAAQHFLADRAGGMIVAFDHHAAGPEVSILTNIRKSAGTRGHSAPRGSTAAKPGSCVRKNRGRLERSRIDDCLVSAIADGPV